MAGCDAVVHVAGLTIATDRDAFGGSTRSDGGARARGRRRRREFAFSTSPRCPRRGPSRDGLPPDPDAPRHPISPYGHSKAEGEVAALALAGAMQVQIIRPPVVYGPRDLGLLPFFRMARWRYVVRVGDGRNRVSVIYGPDLADAIVALLAQPPGGPAIFHISDAGGPYDWRTLIAALAGAFGHRLLTVPVPGARVRRAGARRYRLGPPAWGAAVGRRVARRRDAAVRLAGGQRASQRSHRMDPRDVAGRWSGRHAALVPRQRLGLMAAPPLLSVDIDGVLARPPFGLSVAMNRDVSLPVRPSALATTPPPAASSARPRAARRLLPAALRRASAPAGRARHAGGGHGVGLWVDRADRARLARARRHRALGCGATTCCPASRRSA